MQVSSANDVKIYSLTAGKSLPDWIEDRAKRRKKSEAPGYSSAIQLIQDFDMPVISNRVAVSRAVNGRVIGFDDSSYDSGWQFNEKYSVAGKIRLRVHV